MDSVGVARTGRQTVDDQDMDANLQGGNYLVYQVVQCALPVLVSRRNDLDHRHNAIPGGLPDQNRTLSSQVECQILCFQRNAHARRSLSQRDHPAARFIIRTRPPVRLVGIFLRLQGQHVRTDITRPLLAERVVFRREYVIVQRLLQLGDPRVVKRMEDPELGASPIVHRHRASSLICGWRFSSCRGWCCSSIGYTGL